MKVLRTIAGNTLLKRKKNTKNLHIERKRMNDKEASGTISQRQVAIKKKYRRTTEKEGKTAGTKLAKKKRAKCQQLKKTKKEMNK